MSASFGTRAIDEPISVTLATGVGLDDYGYLMKIADSGATVDKTAAVTDAFAGVAVDSTVDATTGLTNTGGLASIQVGGVVPIKGIAGTYRFMDAIYAAQTAEADGHVKNDSSNSAARVGTYVGEDNLTIVDGEHLEVVLLLQ